MSDSEKKISLAVLMTCHNRVENTMACLQSLKDQEPYDASTAIFLVDDGSTDGTSSEVARMYPDVTIIQGDGSLYWCGGMRVAFAQAILKDYDFYLWLNDDTHLEKNALFRLFQTYTQVTFQSGKPVITVGSTYSPKSNLMSYGGWRQVTGRKLSTAWEKVLPDAKQWVNCDTMNGNCVLIPQDVVKKVGNLDSSFTHSIGDIDYGLRARNEGCQVVIASGYYGVCDVNDGSGLWRDQRLPILTRWKRFLGPKGFPVKEWMIFSRRHRGKAWFFAWLGTYIMFWIHLIRNSRFSP